MQQKPYNWQEPKAHVQRMQETSVKQALHIFWNPFYRIFLPKEHCVQEAYLFLKCTRDFADCSSDILPWTLLWERTA